MICVSGGEVLQTWHQALAIKSLAIFSRSLAHQVLGFSRQSIVGVDKKGRPSAQGVYDRTVPVIRKSNSGKVRDEQQHFPRD
jgi:hypothetical protein